MLRKTMSSKIALLIILFVGLVFAQSPLEKRSSTLINKLATSKSDSILVWIYFTDKPNVLKKDIFSIQSIISKKSIERRSKSLSSANIIDFTDYPISEHYLNTLSTYSIAVKNKSKWFNSVSAWVTKNQIDALNSLNFISKIDVVEAFMRKPDPVETASHYLNKINLGDTADYNYGSSFYQMTTIGSDKLHRLGLKGQGVTIAVMDAGFNNLTHEVFSGIKILATYDFVNHRTFVGDGNGGEGAGYHGTSVLSLIGGYKPGKMIGPAFEASYILAKTENTASETPVEEDNWIAAIEWADSIGVDITTTSLGYNVFDPPFTSYTWENMDGRTCKISVAANLAARKGITVFNSASNEGYNSTHNTLTAPADADSIITVGADSLGVRASFSSVGNTADGRTKPDVMAPGSFVYLAGSSGPSYYFAGNGTSYSTPLVAGLAAQLLSANPKLTNMQIRAALRNTASNSQSPNREIGWGLVDGQAAYNYITTGIDSQYLKSFHLMQNYPNPFNGGTYIYYNLIENSNVSLEIYSIDGRMIDRYDLGYKQIGESNFHLRMNNLASGIYLYRLVHANGKNTNLSEIKKMIYLK